MDAFYETDISKRWAQLASRCRMEITFTGEYFKERWLWTAIGPDGDLRSDYADTASEAAVLAKYAISDYVDAVVGGVR